MDLVAEDTEISLEVASDDDLCFTQVTQTYTNESDVISLKRRVFSSVVVFSNLSRQNRAQRNLLRRKKRVYYLSAVRKLND